MTLEAKIKKRLLAEMEEGSVIQQVHLLNETEPKRQTAQHPSKYAMPITGTQEK